MKEEKSAQPGIIPQNARDGAVVAVPQVDCLEHRYLRGEGRCVILGNRRIEILS
jgi:hypothetical protein